MVQKPLTLQQKKVLECVDDHIRSEGFSPSLREIGQAVGIANVNAVRGHLTALEKKGYIDRQADKARSIRLLQTPSALSQLRKTIHKVLRTDEGVLQRVIYGVAWTTRKMRPLLTDKALSRVEKAFDREIVERGWRLIEKRVEADHCVFVLEVWANHSPEQVVKRFKTAARAAKVKHLNDFPRSLLWGKGYAATTEIELLDDLIERLIEQQKTDAE